jgi:hypothetical protein
MKDQPCETADACPHGKCVIDFSATQPMKIPGILTLIVDDETNGPNSTIAECVSLTILLEVRRGGKPYFLSRNYRCLPARGPDSLFNFDTTFLASESALNDALTNESILNRFLFHTLDAQPSTVSAPLSQALRDLFQTPGNPIIVETPKKVDAVEYTNREADQLASVVRLAVEISFVVNEHGPE